MNTTADIAHRSRTGNKIHRSPLGSSVSNCGYWAKIQTSKLRSRGKVHRANLCEKCFPNPTAEDLLPLGIELVD